jgi:glycosyltransferase involved in cell wall biosynthesis
LVTKALQYKYAITVMVREDYQTDHFRELMSDLSCEVISVPGTFNGQWLPKISAFQWWAYISALLEFDRKQKMPYGLFFMALDDYFIPFFLLGWSRWFFRKIDRVWTVKYRVECLTAGIDNLRQWVIGFVMRYTCRIWKIKTIVLDERLKNLKVGGTEVNWLPDPWFGNFNLNRSMDARAGSHFSADDFVALIIGRQDERKGFPFLLEVLPRALEELPELKISICGKIENRLVHEFEQLESQFGSDRIIHDPQFISEEDLPDTYASASVVLMPYAPFFTSTSGVLPRAAACGVPTLASEHGLVGERVRRYPLGKTFRYGDVDGFINSLREIRNERYSESVQAGCMEFASSCSEETFIKSVRDLI